MNNLKPMIWADKYNGVLQYRYHSYSMPKKIGQVWEVVWVRVAPLAWGHVLDHIRDEFYATDGKNKN